MDTMLLRVFQFQVLLQCRFVLRAADDLNRVLSVVQDTTLQQAWREAQFDQWIQKAQSEIIFPFEAVIAHEMRGGMETVGWVFYAIQNLLNAVGNIHKALWGQGGRLAAQRQALRDSIGISDTSPLYALGMREDALEMRNNFEHYDDRLDKWWRESQKHTHVDLMIGPLEVHTAHGILDTTDIFRLYDPESTDVIFWGQRFNLRALIDEVTRILPALEIEAAKPHWNPEAPQA